jgi:hypothetical protein
LRNCNCNFICLNSNWRKYLTFVLVNYWPRHGRMTHHHVADYRVGVVEVKCNVADD